MRLPETDKSCSFCRFLKSSGKAVNKLSSNSLKKIKGAVKYDDLEFNVKYTYKTFNRVRFFRAPGAIFSIRFLFINL